MYGWTIPLNKKKKFRPLKQCSEIPEYIDLSDTTKLIQEADISLFCPARNRIHYFDGGGRMAVEFLKNGSIQSIWYAWVRPE